MAENLEMPPETRKELEEVVSELSAVVQRAMLEVAELKEIEARVTEVSERISKLTPPPEAIPPP